MTLYLHDTTANRVVLEMSVDELSLITTMLGYSCAAAQRRGHWRILKTFKELSKKFLDGTTIKVEGVAS